MSRAFGKFSLCLGVFAAHYRKAPLQAGAIIIGITLAVTLLTGVRAINENATRSYSDTTEQLSQQAAWLVTPLPGKKSFDEQVYFDLRAAGFSQSLAVVEGTLASDDGRYWQAQASDIIAALTAISLDSEDKSNKPVMFGVRLPLARMLAGEPIVIMSRKQADMVSGSKIRFSGEVVEVIGLDESFNIGNRILMDISLGQRLLASEGRLSYIALFNQPDLKNLRQITGNRAVITESQNGEDMAALTQSFHLNLTAMSMLAFIVGLFIAYNGVRYSLLKRQRLFTQLQQLGVEKRLLLQALCFELILLVVMGSVIGFILGLQLSHWLHPMVAVTLEQLYDATLLPGIWRWSWLLQAILITLVSSILACSSLFIQLMRQPLARTTGQYYQQKDASKVHKIQFIIALLLGLIVLILLPFSYDYRQTMVLLGLVVIAIPLALPRSLSLIINMLSRFFTRGLVGYQVAETKELIAPMSLAMMAILLAVTANIAMNTLVSSFELTLKQWLDARLHADLYVRPAQTQITEVEQFLKQQPEVSAVYTQFYQRSQHGPLPINLVTKDRKTLRQTTIFKSAEPDIWSQFFAGKMVIISEPMAIRQGLKQGETIELAAIPDRSFIVGGVFYDYGRPYGEVLISPEIWQKNGFSDIPNSLGVSLREEPYKLRVLLKQQLGISDALMYDQKQIRQRAIEIFTKTFAITRVLNSLTLIVAAIGLFSACFMLTQARAAPIARLYSLGVSRKKLRAMVIGQMLIIVLLTCLVALPSGMILGYLLINHVTLQAFGWSIAMQWSWQIYAEVVALALISSSLAVAWPLYHQTKKPLVSSLQSEVI